MTFGNVPDSQTVLTLAARKSFALGVRFLRSKDSSAVDLTGAVVRLVVSNPSHRGGAVVLDLDGVSVGADSYGQVQFAIQAADLDLAADEYPYSITLLSAEGYSTLVVHGVIDLRENTESESTTSTYPPVSSSSNLAVYVENGALIELRIDSVDGLSMTINQMISELQSQNTVTMLEMTQILNQVRAMYDYIVANPGSGGGGSGPPPSEDGPVLVEDVNDPGTYTILLPSQIVEDPNDPGTYLITSGSNLTHDTADPGTYLIGA